MPSDQPNGGDYDPKQVSGLQPEALARAEADGVAAFGAAADLAELAAAHTAHLGDRSPIALANREIGALPPQARKDAGQRIGAARGGLSRAFEAAKATLEAAALDAQLANETVDVTLPVDGGALPGARHPLTAIQERVADLFIAMGWEIAEGPEVEAEWFNFDALGIGPDHPARSDQDTIYIAPEGSRVCLRTQTSPVQIRSLLERDLPIYLACPGRVFRADTVDATHLPVFTQVEGIVVDEGITMGHLKGTLDAFARGMFGEGIVTRLRPSYFPFTEPSAEVDLQCFVCAGTGVIRAGAAARASQGAPATEERSTASAGNAGDVRCPTCKGDGWIEWGGCGMVAPGVLRACGVTPVEDGGKWSGFAFGMGLERTLMQRHGVADIRDLVEGDVRFTRVFGVEG